MPRIPLTYTFGNHMHRVDMEWLWGYHVLPGSVAKAYKTNLMNEIEAELVVEGNQIQLAVRPYEIATVVFDLIPGRKQMRDLDAKREIWATVHRINSVD